MYKFSSRSRSGGGVIFRTIFTPVKMKSFYRPIVDLSSHNPEVHIVDQVHLLTTLPAVLRTILSPLSGPGVGGIVAILFVLNYCSQSSELCLK